MAHCDVHKWADWDGITRVIVTVVNAGWAINAPAVGGSMGRS